MNTKKYIHVALKALAFVAVISMAMLAWSATAQVNRLASHATQLKAENRHLSALVEEAYNINEQTHTDNAHN